MLSNIPNSRLGYGCYALAGAYGTKIDGSRAIKLIELAYDLGIRFFDTAEQYGTEAVLAKAVRPFRQQISIATKVGKAAAKASLTRNQIMASCEASLRRLDTDYIDLFQVHYDDPQTPVEEVVESLELLLAQGKIRAYGVGHLPLAKTKTYLDLGSPATVLAEMNPAALNRYRELHPLQGSHDFDIIAFSVTGRGLLTGTVSAASHFSPGDLRRVDPLFQRNKLESGLRIMEKLAATGRRLGATPAQLAIAWVLSQPGVQIALTGPTNPDHLRENCAALNLKLEANWHREISEFILHQEEQLQHQLHQELWSILNRPVANCRTAEKDLLYVLEHCIEAALIPYQAGVGLFSELQQLSRAGADTASYQSLLDKVRTLLESTTA